MYYEEECESIMNLNVLFSIVNLFSFSKRWNCCLAYKDALRIIIALCYTEEIKEIYYLSVLFSSYTNFNYNQKTLRTNNLNRDN